VTGWDSPRRAAPPRLPQSEPERERVGNPSRAREEAVRVCPSRDRQGAPQHASQQVANKRDLPYHLLGQLAGLVPRFQINPPAIPMSVQEVTHLQHVARFALPPLGVVLGNA
jgi:hypothetical protein